jgi:hypothetical protein
VLEYAAPKPSPIWVSMNQDIFNLQTCRSLKKVGIQSQREIEWAVRPGNFLVVAVGIEATIEGKIAES